MDIHKILFVVTIAGSLFLGAVSYVADSRDCLYVACFVLALAMFNPYVDRIFSE